MSASEVATIRLVSIGKRYAGTSALDDVSLEIKAGTVHALVGANGAGKSTLGKVIGGVVRPDDGEMFVDGRAVKYATPRDARSDGIATIAQELALAPAMSVLENVFLGTEPRRAGVVAKREMRKRYAELISRSGFDLDRDALVGSLRTADQQKVEILRAVNSDARIIIMDEPTSSLTSVETEALHKMTRSLRDQGKTIVYVSHFLDEVLDLCDTVTVMRNGHHVRTGPAVEETEASLVAGMFGAAVEAEQFDKPPPSTADPMLEVEGLRRRDILHDISLTVRKGEIVGLAGLVGSGRTELARAIAGADPIDAGTIKVAGKARRIRNSADGIRAGIAFLTEDRKHDGLFMDLALAANTTMVDLTSVSARGILRLGAERSRSRKLLDSLNVDPPMPGARANSLSGGNQQKVLFARWLFRHPKVLILDEPTRGVDVGARAAIHRLISELADEGAAVLMISSEIEEVLGLAHRVLVMRRGAITKEFGADPPLSDVMEAVFGLSGSDA
ncbi:MAG TPA: sugar ABC transporter ATP-binding protein [Solirubrobacteraceae bacterium]|jgi:ABC-type sugar transport system ATPase subunit